MVRDRLQAIDSRRHTTRSASSKLRAAPANSRLAGSDTVTCQQFRTCVEEAVVAGFAHHIDVRGTIQQRLAQHQGSSELGRVAGDHHHPARGAEVQLRRWKHQHRTIASLDHADQQGCGARDDEGGRCKQIVTLLRVALEADLAEPGRGLVWRLAMTSDRRGLRRGAGPGLSINAADFGAEASTKLDRGFDHGGCWSALIVDEHDNGHWRTSLFGVCQGAAGGYWEPYVVRPDLSSGLSPSRGDAVLGTEAGPAARCNGQTDVGSVPRFEIGDQVVARFGIANAFAGHPDPGHGRGGCSYKKPQSIGVPDLAKQVSLSAMFKGVGVLAPSRRQSVLRAAPHAAARFAGHNARSMAEPGKLAVVLGHHPPRVISAGLEYANMNQTASSAVPDTSDHALILGSRVNDTPVFSKNGERIGHIDDLSIERVSGKVVYAIMSFGGFLGIGEKFHPIPWSLLDYDPERGGYVVPLDKKALEEAPHYDRYELTALGGPEHLSYGERIFGFYGPYGPVPYF